MRAACNRAEFYENLLFVRAELLQGASFVGAEQSAAGATVVGLSTLNGSGSALMDQYDHSSGHTAMLAEDGSVLTVDWLAEEGDAFGSGRQRRRCLFAGTAEHAGG